MPAERVFVTGASGQDGGLLLARLLVEGADEDAAAAAAVAVGRAAHQGPDVDGVTYLPGVAARPGTLVRARVAGSEGVDLVAEPVEGAAVAPAGAVPMAAAVPPVPAAAPAGAPR